MKKIQKLIILTVLILPLFFFYGCNKEEAGTPGPAVTPYVDEINADTLQKYA